MAKFRIYTFKEHFRENTYYLRDSLSFLLFLFQICHCPEFKCGFKQLRKLILYHVVEERYIYISYYFPLQIFNCILSTTVRMK